MRGKEWMGKKMDDWKIGGRRAEVPLKRGAPDDRRQSESNRKICVCKGCEQ